MYPCWSTLNIRQSDKDRSRSVLENKLYFLIPLFRLLLPNNFYYHQFILIWDINHIILRWQQLLIEQ